MDNNPLLSKDDKINDTIDTNEANETKEINKTEISETIKINIDQVNELELQKLNKKICKYSYTRDAYEQANFCSKLFFCWAYRTLKVL